MLTHVLQKIQIKPDGIFWETISQQYIDDGTVKPYSPQDLSLLKELSEIAYLDRYQFLAALSKLAPLMGCSTPKESYFRHFPEKSFASSRSLVDLHKLLHQTRQYHFEFVQSGWALEQLKSVHQYQQDVGYYFNYMQRKYSLSDERLCDGSESIVNTMAVFFQQNFKTY